jgi:hypothetical protein
MAFLMEDGTYVEGWAASCGNSPIGDLQLGCEPDVHQTLDPPSGSLLVFRSDQDEGCVLSGRCETKRTYYPDTL